MFKLPYQDEITAAAKDLLATVETTKASQARCRALRERGIEYKRLHYRSLDKEQRRQLDEGISFLDKQIKDTDRAFKRLGIKVEKPKQAEAVVPSNLSPEQRRVQSVADKYISRATGSGYDRR